MIENMKHNKQ